MDVDATQHTVYCGLPRQVRINNEDVLEPPSLEEDPLMSFIKQAVPQKRISQGLAADLKYKVHYLENDYGYKKHKFDKSGAKKKILSAKEKRKLKLMKLNPKEHEYKYVDYLPMHQLWFDYIRDLLHIDKITPKNKQEAEMKLLKSDYHGAMVTVSASKSPSLVGQTGIIVMETKNTFQIIRKDDKLKMLPKRDTNYTIKVDDYVLTIYGNQLQVKPCMRTVRKFKYKPTVDL